MKLAIHHRNNSFSERWVQYCQENNIDYKIVDALDSDIISQIEDCEYFLWHYSQAIYEDMMVARKLLSAIEEKGIKVYPDTKTSWHFDDKVSQKYLLEAINAPLVNSYVFYNKSYAINWFSQTSYPKVFKLKGGAGAENVQLIKSKKEALKLVRKAFGRGFNQFNKWNFLKERYNGFINGKNGILDIFKGIIRLFFTPKFGRLQPKEKGYIYVQDFIANNNFDTRVVVIGGKWAAAEKRFVRKNDFRASGSGLYTYENIDVKIIKLAFEVSKKLNMQSVAFDFIYNKNEPLIIEMSYCFGTGGIKNVPGYWDDNLKWYNEKFDPEVLILKYLINK